MVDQRGGGVLLTPQAIELSGSLPWSWSCLLFGGASANGFGSEVTPEIPGTPGHTGRGVDPLCGMERESGSRWLVNVGGISHPHPSGLPPKPCHCGGRSKTGSAQEGIQLAMDQFGDEEALARRPTERVRASGDAAEDKLAGGLWSSRQQTRCRNYFSPPKNSRT